MTKPTDKHPDDEFDRLTQNVSMAYGALDVAKKSTGFFAAQYNVVNATDNLSAAVCALNNYVKRRISDK